MTLLNISPVHAIYVNGQFQWCKGVTATAQNFGTFSFGGGCITALNPPMYNPTDPEAFFLAQLASINGVYEFFTQWRDPSGNLCNECTHDSGLIDLSAVNAISLSDSIQIAGRLPASQQGTWTVELIADAGGVIESLGTSSFTIGSPTTQPTTYAVTISVAPGDAAANAGLTVDGQPSTSGGQYTWTQEGQHAISVQTNAAGANAGTRYVFTGWSDGVSASTRSVTATSNMALIAQYKTQYMLTVNSDHGSATGTDWYDAGTQAYASLDTGTVSDNLFYDWVFAGWTSGASGANLQSNPITMDGPKTATATWNNQFSTAFYEIVAAIIILAIVAAAVVLMAKTGRLGRGKGEVSPGATHEAPKAKGKKHCTNCGSLLPANVAFCPSCGKST